MFKRIILGISGASGVIYGVRILSLLSKMECEVHLVVSESGKKNIRIETDYEYNQLAEMADFVYAAKT